MSLQTLLALAAAVASAVYLLREFAIDSGVRSSTCGGCAAGPCPLTKASTAGGGTSPAPGS